MILLNNETEEWPFCKYTAIYVLVTIVVNCYVHILTGELSYSYVLICYTAHAPNCRYQNDVLEDRSTWKSNILSLPILVKYFIIVCTSEINYRFFINSHLSMSMECTSNRELLFSDCVSQFRRSVCHSEMKNNKCTKITIQVTYSAPSLKKDKNANKNHYGADMQSMIM